MTDLWSFYVNNWSVNLHQLPTKMITEVNFNKPFYVCHDSAQLKYILLHFMLDLLTLENEENKEEKKIVHFYLRIG